MSTLNRNIPQFNGEKYTSWKLRIKSLFFELDLMKVFEDRPISNANDWDMAQRTAKGLLTSYLADSMLTFAKPELTVKQIFENLDNKYERTCATEVGLRMKLMKLKFNGENLNNHFMVFDSLISQLSSAGVKVDEPEKIAFLLITLPVAYDPVAVVLGTVSDNELNLDYVKKKLLDHEISLNSIKDELTKELSANEQSLDCAKKRLMEHELMFNFKQEDNEVVSVQKPQTNPKPSNKLIKKLLNKKNATTSKCYHCGRSGHLRVNCYYYKSNKLYGCGKRTLQTVQIQKQEENNEFALSIGNYSNINLNMDYLHCILDSGASNHITNRWDLAENFADLMTPIPIAVAKNGAFIEATKQGTIDVLTNDGVPGKLVDVLYSADISHTLMSVIKLQEAGMAVVFDQRGVHIYKDGKNIFGDKQLGFIKAKHGPNTVELRLVTGPKPEYANI